MLSQTLLYSDRDFVRRSLASNVRLDGRELHESRELIMCKDIALFPTALQGVKIEVPDSKTSLMIGLNAEIFLVSDGKKAELKDLVELEVKSTISRTIGEDPEFAEIEAVASKFLLSRLDIEKLKISDNVHWKIFLDVLVVGDLYLCDLDYLFEGLTETLCTAEFPNVRVSFNSWSEEHVYETLEDSKALFNREDMLTVKVIGEIDSKIVLDMNNDELRSVDSFYVVSVNQKGDITCIEKLDGQAIDVNKLSMVLKKLTEFAKSLRKTA